MLSINIIHNHYNTKITKMYKLILLFSYVTVFSHSFRTLDLVETNYVNLYSSTSNSLTNTVDVPLQNTLKFTKYELAVSIQNIQNYYPNSKNGHDFKINCQKYPDRIQCSLFITSTTCWTMTKFVYLVTARSDVRAGFFTVIHNSLSTEYKETIMITKKLQSIFNSTRSTPNSFAIFIPFISGVKTADISFGINLIGEQFLVPEDLLMTIEISYLKSMKIALEFHYLVVEIDSDYVVESLIDLEIYPLIQDFFVGIRSTNMDKSKIPKLNEGLGICNFEKQMSVILNTISSRNIISSLNLTKNFQNFFVVEGVVLKMPNEEDLLPSTGTIQASGITFKPIMNANSQVQRLRIQPIPSI